MANLPTSVKLSLFNSLCGTGISQDRVDMIVDDNLAPNRRRSISNQATEIAASHQSYYVYRFISMWSIEYLRWRQVDNPRFPVTWMSPMAYISYTMHGLLCFDAMASCNIYGILSLPYNNNATAKRLCGTIEAYGLSIYRWLSARLQ